MTLNCAKCRSLFGIDNLAYIESRTATTINRSAD